MQSRIGKWYHRNMEANTSEVEKLVLTRLTRLPLELRRQLLASMTESLRTATDPLDIRALEVGIANLKASLD